MQTNVNLDQNNDVRTDPTATFTPTDHDRRIGEQIHAAFAAKPESGRIASAFSLAHLSACLRVLRPATVLELGAGIGTISKLILEHPNRPERLITTENNQVCLDALKINLASVDQSGVTLVQSLDELLELDFDYPFAICDGGFGTWEQFRGIRNDSTCFFDGSRAPHRRALNEYLEQKNLMCELRNYSQPGFKLILKTRKTKDGFPVPRPKIKRQKGCWIGTVHIASEK